MPMNHNPSIMVTMKTRVGRDRVGRIIVNLPFDGFLTTNTTGYAGGLQVLWKRGEVETILLASKEQGIHATIKVHSSNLSLLISAIYASPQLAKTRILWSNLMEVTQFHNLPWLMLGDFNEVLCGNDKYGG